MGGGAASPVATARGMGVAIRPSQCAGWHFRYAPVGAFGGNLFTLRLFRPQGTSILGTSGMGAPLLTSAAAAPGRTSHAGAGNASHKVFPKTAEFRGCSPPPPMWGRQGGWGRGPPAPCAYKAAMFTGSVGCSQKPPATSFIALTVTQAARCFGNHLSNQSSASFPLKGIPKGAGIEVGALGICRCQPLGPCPWPGCMPQRPAGAPGVTPQKRRFLPSIDGPPRTAVAQLRT